MLPLPELDELELDELDEELELLEELDEELLLEEPLELEELELLDDELEELPDEDELPPHAVKAPMVKHNNPALSSASVLPPEFDFFIYAPCGTREMETSR